MSAVLFIVRCIFSPSVLFFRISSTGLLSIIIKAYSLGTSTCHTTNILNWWIDQTVQRNKPPLHEFPNLQISQMLFRKSFLVRSSFIWFLDFVSLLDWLYNSTALLFCQHYFYIFIILFYFIFVILLLSVNSDFLFMFFWYIA